MIDDDSGEVSAMKLWPSTGAKYINEKLLVQRKFRIEKVVAILNLIIEKKIIHNSVNLKIDQT